MKLTTFLGSLAQLCCGEGRTLQAIVAGMRREHWQNWTTQGLPQPSVGAQAHGAQAPVCTTRALSQVGCASPQGSWSQAVTLPADISHPGSQEDVGSNWQSAHSLADAASEAEIAAASCLLPLSVAHLPLRL